MKRYLFYFGLPVWIFLATQFAQAAVTINFTGDGKSATYRTELQIVLAVQVGGTVQLREAEGDSDRVFLEGESPGLFGPLEFFGEIGINLTPRGGDVSAFDPVSWSGGSPPDADQVWLQMRTAGMGVSTSETTGGFHSGEAVMMSFDLGNLKLPPGWKLILTGVKFDKDNGEIWEKVAEGSGRQIGKVGSNPLEGLPEGVKIHDGSVFGILAQRNANRLLSLTLDLASDQEVVAEGEPKETERVTTKNPEPPKVDKAPKPDHGLFIPLRE